MEIVDALEVETNGATLRVALCDFGGGWHEVHLSAMADGLGQLGWTKKYVGPDPECAARAYRDAIADLNPGDPRV